MQETSTAAERTFDIIELYEQILLHLPPKTLLHMQRLNKTSKATIENSTRLKEALWFKQPPTSSLGENIEDVHLNPLLKGFYPSKARYPWCHAYSYGLRSSIDVALSNEAVARLWQNASFGDMLVWDRLPRDGLLCVMIQAENTRHHELFLCLKYGEFGFETPPTVMELVEMVLAHPGTTRRIMMLFQ